MNSFLIILLVVVVAFIVYKMYTTKVSLKSSRLISGILLVINILLYQQYASLYANSWHDPRIGCGNQGLTDIIIFVIWFPLFIAFAGSAIWWLISEIKEPGNKQVILKILIPCVLATTWVLGITQNTFWNPNAYRYEMERKYEAGLLDEEEKWDDIDKAVDEDSIGTGSAKVAADTIINQ